MANSLTRISVQGWFIKHKLSRGIMRFEITMRGTGTTKIEKHHALPNNDNTAVRLL